MVGNRHFSLQAIRLGACTGTRQDGAETVPISEKNLSPHFDAAAKRHQTKHEANVNNLVVLYSIIYLALYCFLIFFGRGVV